MSQSISQRLLMQVILLVLIVCFATVSPIVAEELDVDQLIKTIRERITEAEKQGKEKALFALKEVKLSIAYTLEKRGGGGLKAFVVTADMAVNSHAVQSMEVTLIPTRQIKVEEVNPDTTINATVQDVDKNSNTLTLKTGKKENETLEFQAPAGFLKELQEGDRVEVSIRKRGYK